ncbi:carnitine dehydratase [Frondihabitans sp. PAMC 28766]|uniref:CaiB/BaiF CoA transferase family protein n=1 Tax=Frondihabitans sp. PAMC 28766 TaxID=1795630 RepID=UPI00078EC610|nr:CoA transferase [Frondihabitans sp. PAMC 28766]AMM20750.1 carnitine dehydratase [Frondihabitans sp. PAMC 28766]
MIDVDPVPADHSSADGPLAGLTVADFSRVLAGPFATMTLADLGADVIKIERPGTGDETRHWGPPWSPSGTSSYFDSVNRGKRSIALDLADPDDRRTARAIALRADVVVENFRPGLMDSFGLGHAALSAANRGVVVCSISGFGSGAGSEIPGYDFVVQAVGGLMSITGEPGAAPMKAGVALVDVLTGKDAVIGILAALRERETSGRGQHVEVNLLSSLLGSLVNQAGGYLATGTPPGRLGNRHPSIAPYETLECADGPLAVAVGNDEQFGRFAVALGLPSLAVDTRFATNALRVANRDALAAAAEEILRTEPAAVWQARLQSARIAAGAVGTIADAFALADRLGLDPTWSPGDGELRQVRNPVRLSRTPARQPGPPPRLGNTSAADLLDAATSSSPRKA